MQVLSAIDEQLNVLTFSKTNFTLIPKKCALLAYKKYAQEEPEQMFNYLLNQSRSGGFQNKLFKAFVSEIENELPFFIFKNKKQILVNSILDPNLNIFDGISKFTSKVNNQLKIKNETREIYIGGLKSSIIQPYFIGKLISIKSNNLSLKKKVVDYTFNFIKLKDVNPGDTVSVKHYRAYPHYQMGAMTHINRARLLLISQLKQT